MNPLFELGRKLSETFFHNSNQFASGGLLLMLVGGAAAYFRALPQKIYERFLHLFSMTVVITDDSEAFIWYKWWFQEHKRSKKIRHVDVITPRGPQGRQVMLFPAPGSHWFWYKGRPFRMTFTRTEKEGGNLNRETRPESLELRVVGRNQQFLRTFINEVKEKFQAVNKDYPKLYFLPPLATYWDYVDLNCRPLDSVILPIGIKEDLLKDIGHFEDSKAWYEAAGLPYHRSYLFYGPPGTGKTSTLLGLASHLKKSIYLIKLAHMSDQGLVMCLRDVKSGSMVVFEDVDCLNNKRGALDKKKKATKKKDSPETKEETKALTLSGLLNALDGIETPSNVLFFLTTNLIESLDQALIRPGRVDRRIFLGPATDWQKIEMYKRFFPTEGTAAAEDFVHAHPELKTMAEVQEALKMKRGAE